jgi:hypothetical protein
MYVDVLGITMQHHAIFQSVTSPKVGKNRIVAVIFALYLA